MAAAALQHSKVSVDDLLVSDFATSAQFEDAAFKEYMRILFSFLTAPKYSARFIEEVVGFAPQVGLGVPAMKSIAQSWLTVFKAAQKLNVTPEGMHADLIQLGLPVERANFIAKAYKKNTPAFQRSVVGRTININTLADMEWRFGVSAGSSEVRRGGSAFLQLKLAINNGSKIEQVYMELSLPQFYTLLHELERAKASLESFN